LKLGLGAGVMLGVASFAGRSRAGDTDTLAFDPQAYFELTETITTEAGDKAVTYRFWKAIPYVTKPVDVTCQSLNVSVPVAIDGVAVDATNAPILFANSVGGYMPSSVADAEGVGGGGMTGLPPRGCHGKWRGARGRGPVGRQCHARSRRDGQQRQAGTGGRLCRRRAWRPRQDPHPCRRCPLRGCSGSDRRPESRGSLRALQQGPHPRQH